MLKTQKLNFKKLKTTQFTLKKLLNLGKSPIKK